MRSQRVRHNWATEQQQQHGSTKTQSCKKKTKHSKIKSSFIFQTKKEYKNSKPSKHKIYVSIGIEEETFRQTRRLFLRREERKKGKKKEGRHGRGHGENQWVQLLMSEPNCWDSLCSSSVMFYELISLSDWEHPFLMVVTPSLYFSESLLHWSRLCFCCCFVCYWRERHLFHPRVYFFFFFATIWGM